MSSEGRSYASEQIPEVRSHSNDHLPEVSHVGSPFSAQNPCEDYEFYEQHPPAAPEYQQHSGSPHLSSPQSPGLTSDGSRSPPPAVEGLEPNRDPNRNSRPLSPSSTYHQSQVGSAGLESVYEKEGEKEVDQSVHPVGVVPCQQPQYSSEPERKRRIVCGMAMKWFVVLTALILVAIIAVAVALGVVFGTKHPPVPQPTAHPNSTAPPNATNTSMPAPNQNPTGNPAFTIGGAYGPEYYSKRGAFNGSGIALASVNFGVDASIFVYYQHYTGEIRSMILEANGNWNDGGIVASNARNGTPISVVAFIVNETAQWHLFFINKDNYVTERISSNSTMSQENIWGDGPLNQLNLKANDQDMVGLQACFWGDFYGDSDYSFGGGFNPTNETTTRTGMDLWYADTNTTFQQYSWLDGQTQWSSTDYTWDNQNGHAGVGCYTWATGSTQYVFMVDLTNTLQVYWKDSNSSHASPTHPVNQWNQISEVAIPNVHPSTSMGFTNYLVCQLEDYTIHGYNLTWQAENTTFAPAFGGESGQYDEFIITTGGQNVLGLPGTHLSNTALSQSGNVYLTIFFQTEGSDISIYNRADTSAGGIWTSTTASIDQ